MLDLLTFSKLVNSNEQISRKMRKTPLKFWGKRPSWTVFGQNGTFSKRPLANIFPSFRVLANWKVQEKQSPGCSGSSNNVNLER